MVASALAAGRHALQALEPDELRQLLPEPSESGGDPEGPWGGPGLGAPTVADRIAQIAAAMLLEEPIFHPDNDGYRPGRDCHGALTKTRRRRWRQDWVLDLDIWAFF